MPSSSCFVPYCRTGYMSTRKKNKREGKKNPSMFGSPLDPITFQLWRKKIPRKDRIFSTNDSVCELHFADDCIDRYFTLPLPGGGVEYRLRAHPTLKKGAVPTIFPNCPTYFTEKKAKRKSSKMRTNISTLVDTSDNDNVSVSLPDLPLWTLPKLFIYASNLKLDNFSCSWVRPAVSLQFWQPSADVAHKLIVIDDDLHAKVYIEGMPIHNATIPNIISSESELMCLINTVSNITVCAEMDHSLS